MFLQDIYISAGVPQSKSYLHRSSLKSDFVQRVDVYVMNHNSLKWRCPSVYGRYGIYYAEPNSRQSQQGSTTPDEISTASDRSDDLWIFLRLALVMAVFCAGLACILWAAS
jgi:hypothetical protein